MTQAVLSLPSGERRGSRLLQRDPAMVGRLLTHPTQLRTCTVVEHLLTRLRGLRAWQDYYEFQRVLFGQLWEAEGALGEASRNLKRLERGRSVPEAPSGDWRLEQAVLDRAARQLRSVGDAFAWRLFRFDRRILLALSRNDRPGPIVGKAGLDREIGEVQWLWEHEGVFALLHDLTSSLRIADLTKFTPGGRFIVEVKKSGGVSSAQEQRMRRAIDVVMSGAPLPGPDGDSDLVVASVPFRTRLKELAEALERAERDALSVVRAGRQWVITCMFAAPGLREADVEDLLLECRDLRDRQFRKAEMHLTKHHLRGVRADRADAEPLVAPMTIYPFEPSTCALLTCDLLTYESVLGWDRLAAAFQSAGFRTKCPLPDADESDVAGSADVLQAVRGSGGVTLHASAVNQILLELVEPKSFGLAVREVFDGGISLGTGMFTFANERAVWR